MTPQNSYKMFCNAATAPTVCGEEAIAVDVIEGDTIEDARKLLYRVVSVNDAGGLGEHYEILLSRLGATQAGD